MRILKEALGMRERGHEIFFCVTRGGELVQKARDAGFTVYELPFEKKKFWYVIPSLIRILRRHQIDLVNTHSSIDAWLGGIAAKLAGCKVIRTRHISPKIKEGWKAKLLYGRLADRVVTTCEAVAQNIQKAAALNPSRCQSVPTGVNPDDFAVSSNLRETWGLSSDDFIVGTLCILRSWKGLQDFIEGAAKLKEHKNIKWVIVGSGPMEAALKQKAAGLCLKETLLFTGFQDNPAAALNAFDCFALLSTKNEGVSQASLQAAYLQKPLITTPVGGLPEVCREGETGFVIGLHQIDQLVEKVMTLKEDANLRKAFGEKGREHVLAHFTKNAMLDQMEAIYSDF